MTAVAVKLCVVIRRVFTQQKRCQHLEAAPCCLTATTYSLNL